jgi:hypothetical protein
MHILKAQSISTLLDYINNDVRKEKLTTQNGKEGKEARRAATRQTDATQLRNTSVTGR